MSILQASFKNISIKHKNLTVFSILMFITLGCYGMVFYFSNKQKSQADLVDVSGKNRMLSQRIGAMSQLIGCANEEVSNKAKLELEKAVEAHNNSLILLRDGGTFTSNSGTIEFEPASGDIRVKIAEIQTFFAKHMELCQVLIKESAYSVAVKDSVLFTNAAFKAALDELQSRLINGTLLQHNIELTNMYLGNAQNTRSNFIVALLFLMVLNILCIVTSYSILNSSVAKPISQLAVLSDKISNGDSNIVSTYESKDDIGRISSSINLLTHNLRKSAEFTIKIGQGDFTAQLEVVTNEKVKETENLTLALVNMKNRLVEVAEDDRKRKWVNEGMAKFAEFLRLNHDIEKFSDNLIREIVKYVGANQAGIFLINDDNPNHIFLELKACYAYERKKYLSKIIELGEGLIGQAYLEKDKILLTSIPENYIQITSGLGEAAPRSILVMPLISNDIIEGVLELATFNVWESHEIAFISKLAENIASAISNVRINEKTKRLLSESQMQAEELRAQEEEMRQNMEELSATQEELARKEQGYMEEIILLKNALNQKV